MNEAASLDAPGTRPDYAWAEFASGGTGPLRPAFRCPDCESLAVTGAMRTGASGPEARMRCQRCLAEWHLLMTPLQALRLVFERDADDFLDWAPAVKAEAYGSGISAALRLAWTRLPSA